MKHVSDCRASVINVILKAFRAYYAQRRRFWLILPYIIGNLAALLLSLYCVSASKPFLLKSEQTRTQSVGTRLEVITLCWKAVWTAKEAMSATSLLPWEDSSPSRSREGIGTQFLGLLPFQTEKAAWKNIIFSKFIYFLICLILCIDSLSSKFRQSHNLTAINS